tara:strand:- start:2177 stop:2434 length:258 start_codon:yes stop_codon:yes gene_type:complete
MTDKKVELKTQKTAVKNKNKSSSKKVKLTEQEKIQKRREYMRKYYQKKKMERIASGRVVNPSRPVKKSGSQGFSIKRGEFIISFD